MIAPRLPPSTLAHASTHQKEPTMNQPTTTTTTSQRQMATQHHQAAPIGCPHVETALLAHAWGVDPQTLNRLVDKCHRDFRSLGTIQGNKAEGYALNTAQVHFLLTMAPNTPRARAAKLAMLAQLQPRAVARQTIAVNTSRTRQQEATQ